MYAMHATALHSTREALLLMMAVCELFVWSESHSQQCRQGGEAWGGGGVWGIRSMRMYEGQGWATALLLAVAAHGMFV